MQSRISSEGYRGAANVFQGRISATIKSESLLHLLNLVRGSGLDTVAYVSIWCFMFTVPWEKTVMVEGVGSITRLIGIWVVVIGFLAMTARGWVRRLTWPHWCMAGFVVWASLSYFWSVSPEATMERAFTEIQLVVIVFLIWQFCITGSAAEGLMQAYVYGTFVAFAGTFYRFVVHESTRYERYAAEGFDPNDLSLALAMSIPLSYYLFLRRRGWGLVWILQIGAVLFTCFLTASRMGAVTTLIALSVVLVTADRLRMSQRVLLALGLGLAALMCVQLIPTSSWSRLSSLTTEMEYGTLNHRTEMWALGIEEFTKRPLVGVGAGAFGYAVDPLELLVAHNTFVSVLTELGTVGILLYLSILGGITGAVFRMESLARRTWLVAIIVWAIGVSTLTWEHRKPTWMLFALILQIPPTGCKQRAARLFDFRLGSRRLVNGASFRISEEPARRI